MEKIYKHFERVDPTLHRLMAQVELDPLEPVEESVEYFPRLCREIIAQQLSNAASAAVVSRFEDLFTDGRVSPEQVLRIPDGLVRRAGLSWSKVSYIKGLARDVIDGRLRFEDYLSLEDEAVIEDLTQVKGVGRWTAEMFLIFTLGREDVFSAADLGLRRGAERLYGLDRDNLEPKLAEITGRWSPYRSYGSLVLWEVADGLA